MGLFIMRPLSVEVSQTFDVNFRCNHAQGEPTKRCVIQCVGNSTHTILTVCLGVHHQENGSGESENWDRHEHKTITTWLLDPAYPPSEPPPPYPPSEPPPPYSKDPPSMPDN